MVAQRLDKKVEIEKHHTFNHPQAKAISNIILLGEISRM